MRVPVILVVIAVCLSVGCDSENRTPGGRSPGGEFKPIANGFGYGVYTKGFTHKRVGASLQYRAPHGVISQVWPYVTILWGDNVQINDSTAVFVGGRVDVNEDGVERLTDRLMAFQAPAGPTMDITDQVMGNWCRKNGLGLTNFLKDSFVSLTKTNRALQIEFVVIKKQPNKTDSFGTNALIPWEEIYAIMEDVKRTGTVRNEKGTGMEYLKKE